MKYIISEQQKNLLNFRRKVTPEVLGKYIRSEQLKGEQPCEFKDEYKYMTNLVYWAVTDFIADENLIGTGDEKIQIRKVIMNFCFELFGEDLRNHYLQKCSKN